MTTLTSLLNAARRRFFGRNAQSAPEAGARRQFVRRAGTLGAAAVGAGLMLPDEAWAGIEAGAAHYGITPGTVVDATGRPVASRMGGDPYLGQISLVGWNFAARGWALCDGQLLQISRYSALFSLLGTTFGGDGRNTFGLPDLRGRVAIGFGQGPGLSDIRWGQKGGSERVTLTTAQFPSHTHAQPVARALGTSRSPNGTVPAIDSGSDQLYAPTATAGNAWQPTLSTGGGQPHENRPPLLVMNYQIALEGVFPSRS